LECAAFFRVLYSICGLSLLEYVMRARRSNAAKVAIYLFLFLTQLVAASCCRWRVIRLEV